MPPRAIALLSGGLDSMLAIRLLQEQGIEVEAVNFQTIFTCCKDTAAQAARDLGVRLTVIGQEDAYVELVRKPRYGYGKGANPCIDCRIFMFTRAMEMMEDLGATMVVSGEVLGQRPMSQKRRDLDTIAHDSGLDDLLLRPLSAQLLPPTRAELDGDVDRSRLRSFRGRGRRGLIALAHEYGFQNIPTPSTGCALTERSFAGKVHDLIQLDPASKRWDFELLRVGRHLRMDDATKAVVGRDAAENESLRSMYQREDRRASALLIPVNFTGPSVMLIGQPTQHGLDFAGALVLRYSKKHDPAHALVTRFLGDTVDRVYVHPLERAQAAATL